MVPGMIWMGWESDAEWTLIQQRPVRARLLLYVLLLVFAILAFWASVAEIDEVARGNGRVIPSAHLQIIQSFDGGVVSELLVREGQIIEEGEVLLRVDPTRFLSDLGETRASESALRSRAARLSALVTGAPFVVTPELMATPGVVLDQEKRLYETSQEELEARIAIARDQWEQRREELNEARARHTQAVRALELSSRELDVTQPLVATGAVSEVEVLRLQREVARARGDRDQASAQISRLQSAISESESRILEVELTFKNQWRNELADTLGRLSELAEGTSALEDRVRLAEVRSPMRGVVQRLFVTTRGGVIAPGSEVAEVVPLDDQLLIEAKLSPRDIGFLRPGLEARVKFTAYDFSIYGGLRAMVEHISADSITDEEGNTFYKVRVRTDEPGFGEDLPIITGMVAEVEILTGKKTILEYLLKPILRATQVAFTER
jgi:membrane fusion protein, adhesin transport system